MHANNPLVKMYKTTKKPYKCDSTAFDYDNKVTPNNLCTQCHDVCTRHKRCI